MLHTALHVRASRLHTCPEQLRDVLSAMDTTDPLNDATAKSHALCTAFRERYGVKTNPSGIPVR